MKYRDYKVGFSFEVPDYFSEVRETSYEVFDVAENTLKYFILLDDDGEVVRSFSIVKDEEQVKTDEQYNEVLQKNIDTMEQLGYTKVINNQLKTDSGMIIDRYVFADLDIEENIAVLVYFVRIKDSFVTSSCYIGEFYDEFEEELFNIYNSIEVI